ncbi:MAG: GGDEF domain-containing protein [Verrucomicrobia bacterium]|nr:GGDEF domain-containing protein [Verrucomicrobiota bacterium]MCH8526093.1 GGDEF domain-containing protein [Kiritimatiellia bacterium]
MADLFFLAQTNVTPPIPVVWAVLQTLGVMLAAFAVLALVMSHLRYQNELKRVEAEKRRGMCLDDLRLWILERIRSAPQSLVLFRCAADHREAVHSALRSAVRRGDELLVWRDEGVLLVFAGDDALNAARAGVRLGGLLPEDCPVAVTAAVSPKPPPLKGLLEVVDRLMDELRTGTVPESGRALPACPHPGPPVIPEHEKSLLDGVTGVLSSERVPTAVQKILAAHRRRETPVCLLLCEVDDMETYSESGTSGSVKNGVLKAAADGLMRNCRETDLVGRVSDAGFVLVLAGSVAEIEAVAGRLLESARNESVALDGSTYRYTLSAGLAGYPDHGAGPQRLFAACQEALELAKDRGRGQVLVYDPDVKAPVARPREPERDPEAF